jgi:putative ABC transport system permease protein
MSMSRLREWAERLWSTLRPGRSDADLAEELRAHMDLATDRGRRETGAAQAMEALRDQRGLPWLDTFGRDLHYSARVLRRSPIFTIVAVLSLALGIGVNAAIFQLIDAVRLRSLPVSNPQDLVEIRPNDVHRFGSYQGFNAQATYPLWQQIRTAQRAFSTVEAWGDTQLVVGRGGGEQRPARGLWVSGNLFSLLGIDAERGRLISASDDRRGCAAGPAVISHGFWQSYFGGSESVVGQTIRVADEPFTVIGVTPASFTGLEVGQTFDVALPTCAEERIGPTLDQRDRWWLSLVARLPPGWSLEQATSHLQSLSPGVFGATVPEGFTAELTNGYRKLRLMAIPGGRGVSRLRDTYGSSLSLLLGLTGLLLLITCGNLATLLLARASARERELAIRAALGASRRRLVSQMLIESLLLAVAGAALAVPVAVTSARTLVAFLETPANQVTLSLSTDWRVTAFVAIVAMVTVLLFGCIPAMRVSFIQAGAAMTRTSRRLTLDRHRARFQRALVAIQVAVSLVLVVSALMFVQTFRRLAAVDVGFAQDGTAAVVFSDPTVHALPAEQKVALQRQLTEAIQRVPGVHAAASSTFVPLSGDLWSHFFRVQGWAADRQSVSRFAYVDPEYFSTLGIPLRAGRTFSPSDDARSRQVLIVNESFVRNHLNGRDPVGTVIRRLTEPGYPESDFEIVGVVGDAKYGDLRDEDCWCDAGYTPMVPTAYVPMAQLSNRYGWTPVIVRVSSAAVASSIVSEVKRMNPEMALTFFELKSLIHQRLAGERIVAWLAAAFGGLALLLVIIGLHGLIAYLAVTRTTEIGIRLSLGSTRAEIVKLVLSDSAWMIAIGMTAGVPLALVTMRAVDALLYGLSPTDVPTITAAVAVLAMIAAVAGAFPAWRASRLDPNVVLRAE